MSVDKKILEEIRKYNNINHYISEQEIPLPEPIDGGEEEISLDSDELEMDDVQPVDVASDPDVEVVGEPEVDSVSSEDSGTEELDITDLVTAQKDMSTKQEEYMDSMMDRLNDLTSKLSDMDTIITKINDLEKLSLRSLDSYPYNQKLTDFFMDKGPDMEKTGKNEYVLTSDEVESYTDSDVRKSFDTPFEEEY